MLQSLKSQENPPEANDDLCSSLLIMWVSKWKFFLLHFYHVEKE